MAERPKRKTTTTQTKKKRRISGKAWFYGIFFTVVIGIVCGIIGYLLIILNGERILEEHGGKLEFGEASIIYDAEGEEISRLYDVMDHREVAEFSEIPENMRNAIVATEDQRFYTHSGLDFWAIGRAVVKDVIARSAVEGGSTITQQLAKNVFLTADKTFFRKATEASIAVALEQQLSKEEILTMYLNRIYFGKGIHGVKAAADYYFGVELNELELWQAATLAAMPKAPNRYNPINNPDDSLNRRTVVLQLMYDQKYITAAEMEEAKAVVYEEPTKRDEFKNGNYHAFVDFVIEEAMKMTKKTEEELRIGGYHIYTTLSKQAQNAMDEQFNNPDNFEVSVDEQIVQGAMVIIDHRTGEIKALSGGRDYAKKGWNRVEQPRQPGSAIKPIVSFGPALETGKFFPWTILANDQKCYSNYCPRDRWGATPVSMTQAMKDSRNLAAVWLLNEVGVKQSTEFAEKLGLKFQKEDRNLAMALGGLTRGSSPLQMATAYSIMANGGKSVDPHTITKIKGKKDEFIYKAPKSEQLMSPDTAWYLTEMMQAVVEKGGTGTRANFGRPIAGKTGTTQHGIQGYKGKGIKDAWFVGYTPEWTAAVWMGYDKTDVKHVLKRGGSDAAALFAKVMKPAMQGVDKDSFKRPKGAKEDKPLAKVSNVLATYIPEESKAQISWDPLDEPNMTYEVFRKGSGEAEFSRYAEAGTLTIVDDFTVFPGMTYEYYVVAIDTSSGTKRDKSGIAKLVIPEVPIESPIPTEPTETIPPTDPSGEVTPTDGGIPTPETSLPPLETEQPGTGEVEGGEVPEVPAGSFVPQSTSESGEESIGIGN